MSPHSWKWNEWAVPAVSPSRRACTRTTFRSCDRMHAPADREVWISESRLETGGRGGRERERAQEQRCAHAGVDALVFGPNRPRAPASRLLTQVARISAKRPSTQVVPLPPPAHARTAVAHLRLSRGQRQQHVARDRVALDRLIRSLERTNNLRHVRYFGSLRTVGGTSWRRRQADDSVGLWATGIAVRRRAGVVALPQGKGVGPPIRLWVGVGGDAATRRRGDGTGEGEG